MVVALWSIQELFLHLTASILNAMGWEKFVDSNRNILNLAIPLGIGAILLVLAFISFTGRNEDLDNPQQ
ncbi:MAG: hypothetical protein HY426_00735 [Candidatus Levybacteria bacterium]|nr:hypothetical protein [Candidatus Levybacteria bacterium]